MLPGPRSAASRSASQDGRCARSALVRWITTRMVAGRPVSVGCIARGRFAQRQYHRSGDRRKVECLAQQLLVLLEQGRAVPAMVVLDVSDIDTMVSVVRQRKAGRRKGDHAAHDCARQGQEWTAAVHRIQHRQAPGRCQPVGVAKPLAIPESFAPRFRQSQASHFSLRHSAFDIQPSSGSLRSTGRPNDECRSLKAEVCLIRGYSTAVSTLLSIPSPSLLIAITLYCHSTPRSWFLSMIDGSIARPAGAHSSLPLRVRSTL